MCTACCNGSSSYHTCPPAMHTPYHPCPLVCTPPVTHTQPAMHAPLPCTPPAMHARGVCVGVGMHGRGCAWQGGMHGRLCVCHRGCAYQGAWVVGGVHGRGACMVGGRAIAAGGTHPTGMHSCPTLNHSYPHSPSSDSSLLSLLLSAVLCCRMSWASVTIIRRVWSWLKPNSSCNTERQTRGVREGMNQRRGNEGRNDSK